MDSDSACSDCGGETVAFTVPDSLREYAPDEAREATICSGCLRTAPSPAAATDGDPAASFASVGSYFPDGDAGVAVALLVGNLDSLALHRAEVEALAAAAERAGADVLLALDRLAADDGVDPGFDVDRRRHQVEQLLARERG